MLPASETGLRPRFVAFARFAGIATAVVALIAAAGWIFDGWTGHATGMSNPVQLNMTANKAVTDAADQGSSLGSAPSAETLPASPAAELARMKAAAIPEVWRGVVSIFRDHGYRRLRNKARLKFLVKDWGAQKFREVLENDYLGRRLIDGPAATVAPAPVTMVTTCGVR